jgi:hypothetical protein
MQVAKLESSRSAAARVPRHFLPADDHESGRKSGADPYGMTAAGDDLPYVVEVWDDGKNLVEQTLAITANGSIGYAAYYEATKEYPSRYITLRHKNRVIARWNPPGH